MKVAQNTKRLISQLKIETTAQLNELKITLARIQEHPGTKSRVEALTKAIALLSGWIKEPH